jgi:hypothetical protein
MINNVKNKWLLNINNLKSCIPLHMQLWDIRDSTKSKYSDTIYLKNSIKNTKHSARLNFYKPIII